MKSQLVLPADVLLPNYVSEQLRRLTSQKEVKSIYYGTLPGGNQLCFVVLMDAELHANEYSEQ